MKHTVIVLGGQGIVAEVGLAVHLALVDLIRYSLGNLLADWQPVDVTLGDDAGLALLVDDEACRVGQHEDVLAHEELSDLFVALAAISLSTLALSELDADLAAVLGIVVTVDEKVGLLEAQELLLEQMLVPAAR